MGGGQDHVAPGAHTAQFRVHVQGMDHRDIVVDGDEPGAGRRGADGGHGAAGARAEPDPGPHRRPDADHEGEDSVSLLPALEDPSKDIKRSAIISHATNGRFAISDGEWKLIMPHQKLGYELYHLQQDPGEQTNLYGKQASIQDRLEKRITAMVQNGRTTPGKKQKNDVPWWPDLTWISKN